MLYLVQSFDLEMVWEQAQWYSLEVRELVEIEAKNLITLNKEAGSIKCCIPLGPVERFMDKHMGAPTQEEFQSPLELTVDDEDVVLVCTPDQPREYQVVKVLTHSVAAQRKEGED